MLSDSKQYFPCFAPVRAYTSWWWWCCCLCHQVIKNPVESHLPTGCVKIATSFHAELADVRELVPESQPIVFVVGAMSHGSVSTTLIYTHTQMFNGSLSGTTRVSWYQKGKTNLDFTEARDSEWQWHQLGHMQVCTSLQTNTYTYIQIYIAPKIVRTNLRC